MFHSLYVSVDHRDNYCIVLNDYVSEENGYSCLFSLKLGGEWADNIEMCMNSAHVWCLSLSPRADVHY